MIRIPSFPLLMLFTALAAAAAHAAELKAGVFTPPRMAPDFSLTGSDGSELKLSQYRGKVVLLGFGFSSCAEVCPITLHTLAQARKKLGADADKVQVIYITVDPERDDAARMKKYLSGFDPAFIGGTGTEEQLAAVRKNYGVQASKKTYPDGSYIYAHSSSTYLIDPAGRLRALMPYGRSPEDYVHDVRLLLKSP